MLHNHGRYPLAVATSSHPHHKPTMAASKKVDYERIEPAWLAGILSPRQLADKMKPKADELVTKNAVTTVDTTETKALERDLVKDNAEGIDAMTIQPRGLRLEKRCRSSRFVASKGLGGPPAPRQADGVLSTCRAQQARRDAAAKALLQVQNAMLTLAFAGWTKVWLPADTLSVWLRRKHENARSDLAEFVLRKLRCGIFALDQPRFEFAYFLLERRYLVRLHRQLLLERKHGLPPVSDKLEEFRACLLKLQRVALDDEAFDHRLDAR